MPTTTTMINTLHAILEEFFTEIMHENYIRNSRRDYSLNEIGFADDYEELLYIAKMEPDLPEDTDGLKLSLLMLHRMMSSLSPIYGNKFPDKFDFKQMSALQKIMHERMKKQYKNLWYKKTPERVFFFIVVLF